jgi:hypothetical protein
MRVALEREVAFERLVHILAYQRPEAERDGVPDFAIGHSVAETDVHGRGRRVE